MNELPHINVRSWLSLGWTTFLAHPIPLIGGAVITAIFSILSFALHIIPHHPFQLMSILNGILIPIFYVGWASLCLRTLRGHATHPLDVFDGFSRPWRSWATSFLSALIAGFGGLLLVVPGVIWLLKYSMMSPFAVLDKELTARGNIRFSGKITNGYKGKLFILCVVNAASSIFSAPFTLGFYSPRFALSPTLTVLAFIPFAVSVIITSPWLGASYAAAYDSLVRHNDTMDTPLIAQGTAAPPSPVSPMSTPSSLPSSPS